MRQQYWVYYNEQARYAGGAGVTGVHFHDLRGTFATRQLAAGWALDEVAFCTGHSLRDLRSLERYVNREEVAASRARALADRLTTKAEQILQTAVQTDLEAAS
jgi:integrase